MSKVPVKYRPQKDFPHFAQACALFDIQDGVCFTYEDTYYTNHAPIPADFLVHERVHTRQQSEIGAEEWWRRFFTDTSFRIEQELEAYQKQLNSITNKSVRFNRRQQVIDDLSSPIYGSIITKEELNTLLK